MNGINLFAALLGSIGVVLMLLGPEAWGPITGICAVAVATLLVCRSRSVGEP